MMDKEKWCQASSYINSVVTSQIGVIKAEDTAVWNISLESDSVESLEMVDFLLTIGKENIKKFKIPTLNYESALALMELSTRICIPWICDYASSLLDKPDSIPDDKLLEFLVLADSQRRSCDKNFRRYWKKARQSAQVKVAALIASGAAPENFSKDISISLYEKVVKSAQPENEPDYTEVELPATGGTAVSANGFILTVKLIDRTLSAALTISPENKRALRLTGAGTEQLGIFAYEFTVEPVYRAAEASTDRGCDDSDDDAPPARKAKVLGSKSVEPRQSPACSGAAGELEVGAPPIGLRARFRASMSQLHIRALVLVRYARDASGADWDGSGSPVLGALRYFHGQSESATGGRGGVRAQAGARRLARRLARYAARCFHLVHHFPEFVALPAAIVRDVISRDDLWTDRSEKLVLLAVMLWGRRRRAAAYAETPLENIDEGAAEAPQIASAGRELAGLLALVRFPFIAVGEVQTLAAALQRADLDFARKWGALDRLLEEGLRAQVAADARNRRKRRRSGSDSSSSDADSDDGSDVVPRPEGRWFRAKARAGYGGVPALKVVGTLLPMLTAILSGPRDG